ncbi:MAG: ABC-F family ATP-binding cassette domain-containing protein [Lachnospiraceae bacterium]|nr:ABC-F family ATP-binding cassette domain-containing protein [Lachnospiraceae bacterium]
MILSVNNVSKSYNDEIILNDVNFHLNEHDKCALIGINGCGKTTLINVIIGKLVTSNITGCAIYSSYGIESDSGVVSLSKGASVGYLPQNAILESDNTIYEEVLKVKKPLLDMQDRLRELERSLDGLTGDELNKQMDIYHSLSEEFDRLGGYMIDSEVSGTLKGLGFDESEFNNPVNTLSGGQKTRVALAGLLVGAPDLIILDEPTNHLDIGSITWLEGYLRAYKGAVLIVSHDRYFLDRVVDKVVELENGHATEFVGNYSDYAVKKETLRVAALNAYLNQQRDIKHQQEVIDKLRSFNREKSVKRADSRQKMLNKITLIDKPTGLNDRMQIVLTPKVESGKDVLTITNLSKSYDNLLFSGFDMLLRRGEHVAIIGDNGTGKTTLLKIINGLTDADSGSITLGTNVTVGYYDQEHHVLDDTKTIFDEISDAYPTLKETEIRNTLAAFLFTGDDVYKKIASLSGGEKGRVSLAKLMLGEANLLILDEPTNHLDMTSKEILESAINNYTGTVLYVSHDRYFINRTAERILELRGTTFTEYLGDYDYYLEKSSETAVMDVPSISKSATNTYDSTGSLDYKAQKAAAAEQRKKQKQIDELEAKISEYEERLSEIDAELCDPANGTNTELLIKLQKEKEEIDSNLITAMSDWEKLLNE